MTHNGLNILIAGFGDIGQRIATDLLANADQSGNDIHISVIRRSNVSAPSVTAIQWDMNQPFNGTLPTVDYVIFCASADELSEEGYQRTYIDAQKQLITELTKQNTPIKRYFFCSSTSVYGQQDHEWIDEQSATEPTRFSGIKMLEAEHAVTKHAPWPATIVRATGIYGPGRTRMISQVAQGKVSSAEPIHYSNRIHADDLARFYGFLIHQDQKGESISDVYLACDDLPVTMHDVQTWMAEQMNTKITEFTPAGRTGSKRISNQRMKASGFSLLYPSYQEGMPAQLKSFSEQTK